MPSTAHQILALPPLPVALRWITEFDEATIGALGRRLQEPEAFVLGREKREALHAELGLDHSQVDQLISSLEFLYDHVHHSAADEAEPAEALRGFVQKSGLWSYLGEDPKTTLAKLERLLEKNPYVERARKRQKLQEGILDNAIEFTSFLDLRANFSKNRDSIQEVMAILLFEVVSEKSDGTSQSHVFQLTEERLYMLKRVVEDAVKKIDYFKTNKIINVDIVY